MKGKGYCMYPHLVAAQYKYNVSLLADEQLNPQFEQLGINCFSPGCLQSTKIDIQIHILLLARLSYSRNMKKRLFGLFGFSKHQDRTEVTSSEKIYENWKGRVCGKLSMMLQYWKRNAPTNMMKA